MRSDALGVHSVLKGGIGAGDNEGLTSVTVGTGA
jgi:hypothetical protein